MMPTLPMFRLALIFTGAALLACSSDETSPGGTGGAAQGAGGSGGQNTGGAGQGTGGSGGQSTGGAGQGTGGASGGSGGQGAGGTSSGGQGAGGASTGGQGAGGTSTGGTSSGGAGPGEPTACGIPAAGAPGVAPPSGAADGLTVLDWAGFAAAVSYTFDDANSTQIQNYDALQALGVGMTFYLQTGKSEAADPVWAEAVADGHELGNHTQSHGQTASAGDIDAATEFILDRFGVTAYTMAAPYGDASYVSFAESRFLINRGVNGGRITPGGNSNPFNLPCHIPAEGASADAMNSVIDATRTAGAWQIVLVHGFTGGSDGAYQPVALDAFLSHVEHAKSFGDLWIDTVVDVGAYWIGQKLVDAAEPASAEGGTTWSWVLPDHFPPGKCLRVTTNGGTLTQSGAPVAWNDHGYYEISLDAGNVTLAP